MFVRCVLALILSTVGGVNATPKLQLAYLEDTKALHPQAHERVIQLFQDAGIQINLIPMPPKRAVSSAATGLIDGLTLRTAASVAGHGSLMPVNVPLETISYWIWSTPDQVCVDEETLFASKVPIVVRGHQFFDDVVARSSLPPFYVNSAGSAARILRAGRGDYVLAAKSTVDMIAGAINLDVQRCFSEPFKTIELKVYLHQSHADLIPHIESFYSPN